MPAAVTRAFIASALCVAQPGFADTLLPAVTVTATREQTLLSETPSSVGVIDRGAIDFTRPSHPQQLLGQIPGVAIAVTNGEGHTTAIRQGFTTGPMYLFLEDGIPVRATGNFNHNALYELNLPSAGGVEVVRGIGSALYGSDAIGGLVNVLSRTPRETAGADISVEGGSFGWGRVLGGIDSGRRGSNALRADLNLTHTDGWRDSTAYDRQSVNLRWDHEYDSQTLIKTILGGTHIDQQTGANSALPLSLYLNDPTVNLRSAAYRKVDALRLSSALI
jgi:outer membrane cobalamin receptor